MSALFLPLLCLCSHRCYLSADSVAGTCWAFWRSSMSHARILVSSYCHIPTASMLSHLSRVQLFATLWTVVHQAYLSMGILQATILEWVAMPSSRGSSQPRDQTHISCVTSGFFTTEPRGKLHIPNTYLKIIKLSVWSAGLKIKFIYLSRQ